MRERQFLQVTNKSLAPAPPRRTDRATPPPNVALPPAAGQTPASAFTSVDLPEADGPAIPIAMPGSRRNDTPRTAGTSVPGAATTRCSAWSSAGGAGSGVRMGASGVSRSSRTSDRRPSSARWSTGHCATAWSIGASARPSRIDAAIIMPGVTAPPIASHAPRPSIIDCRNSARLNCTN